MVIALIWVPISIAQIVKKVKRSKTEGTVPSYTPEPVEAEKVSTIEKPTVQGNKTCSHCGHSNEADAKFCLNCGSEA